MRLLLLLVLLLPTIAHASNLRVENVRLISRGETTGELYVLVDVAWDNAWRTDRNHDAAWVFFKYQFPNYNGVVHANLIPDDHAIIDVPGHDAPPATIAVSADSTGLFVYPQENYRGDVRWRIRVSLEPGQYERVRRQGPVLEAFGVEMVYIPAGPFALGDPDPAALGFGAFYQSDASGEPDGLYRIASEAAIAVGPQAGALYYRRSNQYQGDQQGPIPAAFPKGHAAFYVMKYELTQGDYAAFLNTLRDEDTYERFSFGGRGYQDQRGSLRLEGHTYVADQPARPLNFGSWDDQLAWTDWAACRPMTEFEFTKAARGPETPVASGFPWGTNSRDALARVVGPDDDVIMTNGWDESRLSDATRPVFGASYFWVMDLAGSVWERVITPTQPDGRTFTGTHGDGNVRDRGRADNPDWPHDWAQQEGHGYRGGGFYDQGRTVHEFNPHSPVAYRRFGGWAGSYPTRAYGYRCARTAD